MKSADEIVLLVLSFLLSLFYCIIPLEIYEYEYEVI